MYFFLQNFKIKPKSLHFWAVKINYPFFGLDTCFHFKREPDWKERGAKRSVIWLQAA